MGLRHPVHAARDTRVQGASSFLQKSPILSGSFAKNTLLGLLNPVHVARDTIVHTAMYTCKDVSPHTHSRAHALSLALFLSLSLSHTHTHSAHTRTVF